MGQANRLISNVLVTYLRMALTIGIGLVTTRLLLSTLGEVDFGLFYVLGGGLSLIMLISTALSDAAQRHMAYEIGRGDDMALRQVFSTSVVVYLALGVLIAVIGLALRPAFLHGLTIPHDRLIAAGWVYNLTLLNMGLSVLATPFLAVFLARQAMIQDAVFALFTSVAGLVAVLLTPLIHADHLIGYAILITSSRLLFMFLQIVRGLLLFPETHFRPRYFQRSRLRELVGFAGWSFLGSLAWQLRTQGGQILLNIFFGPSVNAAYAVANQVAMYLNNFSGAVLQASRPAMTGLEGKGDRQSLHRMVISSSKFASFAVFLMGLPIILDTDLVLTFWLGSAPTYASVLIPLTITWIFVQNTTAGHANAAIALGQIGKVIRFGMLITISPMPIGIIIFLLFDASPVVYLGLVNVATIGLVIFRVPYIGRMIGFPATLWLQYVIAPLIPIIAAGSLISLTIRLAFPPNPLRIIVIGIFGSGVCLLLSWKYILSSIERNVLLQYFQAIRSHMRSSEQ